ncbi:PilT/PilU family type 4a pilus ATPase [Engelhardtia mirabilis]|uniref:Twitching mobility protein n=1 Tax=Engelhardtia mirabilis TaxID=2528011 RepID=A0A518BP90_9BACT|nr:Twitching mobility protein [Planctomycetes bacterium Pla133]QDV03121.1 Twitching mobility protein [Planctomycetes bacterium Pla86]
MTTHDHQPDGPLGGEPLEFDLDTPPAEPGPPALELEALDPQPGQAPAAHPGPQAPLPRGHAPGAPLGPPRSNMGVDPSEVAPAEDSAPVPEEQSAAPQPLEPADSDAVAALDALGSGERRVGDHSGRSGRRRTDLPGPDLHTLAETGLSPRHQLEAWLAEMVKVEASDLILRAGGRPSCRVDGRIIFLPGRVPAAGPLAEVMTGIIGEDRMVQWRNQGSADVALQLDGLGRFRLNAYRQMGDPALVLRRVADTPPRLETLCLPTGELQKLAKRRRGIVLVTGVAGSGKSTTLSAVIQHMNTTAERHIITLEDPVELIFREDRCVISQREIGTDVSTFSEGLRHALRQSPDVILIGEMRDAETVQAALDATETGHLVMSTLHTVNAAQTVDRIISFFPSEQHTQIRSRLADNLAAVLSQRLVPRREGTGMVPALELMTSTPRVRELLGEGRTAELGKVIESGDGKGLISFNQSLRQLVEAGLIELETALAASDRPDELLLALRGFTTAGGRGRQAQEQSEGKSHLRLESNTDLDMEPGRRRQH